MNEKEVVTMRVLDDKEENGLEDCIINGLHKGDISNPEEVEPLHEPRSSAVNQLGLWCSQKICTLKFLKRRLPIIVWLPRYNLDDLKGDVVAGVTVALTVIPQGLALAQLAKLPPQFGLYTAFMGCFMYTIFGSCKDLTIGPTAIMSLMTAEQVANGYITYCVLLTFLSGCIQLAMGILNLGFLITFISSPVISGFTSAAAITIATTQLGGIFGLKYSSDGFIEDVTNFVSHIQHLENFWNMTMGLLSVIFLLTLGYFREIRFGSWMPQSIGKILEALWWTIATARNALLVLLCAGIAAVLLSYDIHELMLSDEVKPGLPSFELPAFSYNSYDNATNTTIHKDFINIVEDMGTALIVIPLLSILEAIAIGKAFAKGKKLDATQEMMALGICNIVGSFVHSYPATGSFSRTAINHSSGVRTTAGGIVTGSLVLLALGVMSPYFSYVPKAALAALIFVAVINMVHYKDVAIMWKTNRFDLLPFFATFIFSFILGLEYGIIIGVGISLLILLFQEARPKIFVEERKTFLGASYQYIKPDRTVFFPSSEYLQTTIIKSVPGIAAARMFDYEANDLVSNCKPSLIICFEVISNGRIYCIMLDGEHIMGADYTMAMSMKNMIDNFKNENVTVVFINLRMSVQKVIKGTQPKEFVSFISKDEAESFIEVVSNIHMPQASSNESNTHENNLKRSGDKYEHDNLKTVSCHRKSSKC